MQKANEQAAEPDFESIAMIYRSPANQDQPVFISLHIDLDKKTKSARARYQSFDEQNQNQEPESEISVILPQAWYQDVLEIGAKAATQPQAPSDYGVYWILTKNSESQNYWPTDQNQAYIFVEQLAQAILESSDKEGPLQFCVADSSVAAGWLFGLEVFYETKQAKIWKKKPKDTDWQEAKNIDWKSWSDFVGAVSVLNWPNPPTDKIPKTKATFSCDWGEGWLSISPNDRLSEIETKSLGQCSRFLSRFLD